MASDVALQLLQHLLVFLGWFLSIHSVLPSPVLVVLQNISFLAFLAVLGTRKGLFHTGVYEASGCHGVT